jgi:hypothetical protein
MSLDFGVSSCLGGAGGVGETPPAPRAPRIRPGSDNLPGYFISYSYWRPEEKMCLTRYPPSPVPPQLVRTPAAVHPLPHRGEGWDQGPLLNSTRVPSPPQGRGLGILRRSRARGTASQGGWCAATPKRQLRHVVKRRRLRDRTPKAGVDHRTCGQRPFARGKTVPDTFLP